jgi:hypothetical protein
LFRTHHRVSPRLAQDAQQPARAAWAFVEAVIDISVFFRGFCGYFRGRSPVITAARKIC